jgi:hypothetical protein
MLRTDGRLVVSHVGSMVRPPTMISYLQKAQGGEPYDKAAFEACLTESVIDAVRLQAEAGMDVVRMVAYLHRDHRRVKLRAASRPMAVRLRTINGVYHVLVNDEGQHSP